MKIFLAFFLSMLALSTYVQGQTDLTPTAVVESKAQADDQWWAEVRARAEKAAKLKQARYDALADLRNRLYKQAEQASASRSGKTTADLYAELLQKAAPEFAAIRYRYDPEIMGTLKQYVAFLRERKQDETPIARATKSVRPAILYKEKAKYTEAARQSRLQGTVLIRVIFQRDGTIGNIDVVRGLPDGLSDEAVKAAREIIFLPAVKNGEPVSIRMMLEYSFSLF